MSAKRTEKLGKVRLPVPARHPPLPPRRSEGRFAPPPVARVVPAKTVGSFVPGLTRKVFEKFGFSTAALITDWAAIGGADLAGYTLPERLKWPRGGGGEAEDWETDRRGATLMLRVDPARALDVEYRARQIVERINAYFGYRAVETLRIVQAPLDLAPMEDRRESRRAAQPLSAVGERNQDHLTAQTAAPDPLTAALARLERGVRHGRAARGA